MKARPFFAPVFSCILAVACSALLCGQVAERPFDWGAFRTTGSATVGYRWDDIGGRKQTFDELFYLQSGFRLFDFNLTGKAKEGSNPVADNFQLTASGFGGDPFPGGQLTVSKTNLYDLRVNYRQSYYYWDRNDNAILPNGLHGLTSNHNWATVRKFGSLSFLLHATNNLRFRFEYDRNSRDGTIFTTRVMDYFGAPDSWGNFLRANPYYVVGPVNETSNRFAGGIDYTVRNWTIHYTLGYQTFDQAFNWTNLATPERSINIDASATAAELLANGNWTEFRRLNAPSSELFFTGKVLPRLTWRGDFLYFRYSGPATMNASYNGTARVNSAGTVVAPYAIALSSNAQVTEPNYVVDQGFTYKVKEWWNFDADYRFNRFTESGTADFLGRDVAGTYTGSTTQQWRQSINQLDLRMEFTPISRLVFSPGIRLMKRDVVGLDNGEVDPIHTLRTKTAWPIGTVFYQPWKGFSVRGDFQSITNNTSYTRITPHTDIGTRWVFRYRINSKLSIENNLAIRNRKLLNTDFHNTMRLNATTISYAMNERFSAFAGFSYDSFFATNSVTFLRGTPPLNTAWRDQTVNRLWQLGLSAQPTRRFGFSFSGNFVRSTGLGEITGELPRFGPLTFPMATATLHYDLQRAGRIAVDLQRCYYYEQIVRGNDFSANLLTLRWTAVF
jgi:hypothetical protein